MGSFNRIYINFYQTITFLNSENLLAFLKPQNFLPHEVSDEFNKFHLVVDDGVENNCHSIKCARI